MACERCRRPGVWCGYGGVGNVSAACAGGCGDLTRVVSACGAARRYFCAGRPAAEPAAAVPARSHIAARMEPAVQEWKGEEARRLLRADRAAQPTLRMELSEAGHDPATVGRAVVLWNRMFAGQHYTGAHRFARTMLNAGIQGTPAPHAPEWVAPMADEPVWSARSWTTPYPGDGDQPQKWFRSRFGEGVDLAAYDVNGAYLSAAATDLPAGAPELFTAFPASLGNPVDLPGFIRMTRLEGAPHGIASRWEPGMWMPTPLARYLAEARATCEADAAILWPERRRWLAGHVETIREVRAALLASPDPAAAALLEVVRGIYQRMFGGLLSSERYNPGPTFQPVWASLIPATAQARMFRNLDKVRGGATPLVGVHVDAAWFAMPRAYADPPGLPISAQLGKFKPAGRIPWTVEISRAWAEADAETIRKAIADGKE